jgi:hypothetical protein
VVQGSVSGFYDLLLDPVSAEKIKRELFAVSRSALIFAMGQYDLKESKIGIFRFSLIAVMPQRGQ